MKANCAVHNSLSQRSTRRFDERWLLGKRYLITHQLTRLCREHDCESFLDAVRV